jgi:O-antigen/teichoic acid export membrane protein
MGGRIAAGAFWMVLARWGVRLIGIISTLILARLLTPADYGLVGLAILLHFLVQSASDFSLDVDLIRTQTRDRARYDTVWTLEGLRGILNAVLVIAIAIPMSATLGEPRLHAIALCIAVMSVLDGFANVGLVEFRRDLQFSKDFLVMLLTKAVSFAVAIPLAFLLRNYWALVLGMLAASVSRLVLSYVMHPYRPRLSLACWRELLGFSKWLWFTSQLFFVRSKSDEFFVSKWAGVDALGYYRIAREVAQMPTSELITPIMRAIIPGFSRLNSLGATLREGYLLVLSGTVVLMAPLSAGLCVTADLVLGVGFGAQWLPATPLLEVLAIACLVEMFAGQAVTVFLALGQPRYSTHAGLVGALSFLVLLCILVPWKGAVGAAFALLGASLIGSVVNLHLAHALLGLAWRTVARQLIRPLAAAAGMAVVVLGFRQLWPAPPDAIHQAVLLLACAALGTGAYAALLLLLWSQAGRPTGAEATIIAFGERALRRCPPPLARWVSLSRADTPPGGA